jgi:hypothetical protein
MFRVEKLPCQFGMKKINSPGKIELEKHSVMKASRARALYDPCNTVQISVFDFLKLSQYEILDTTLHLLTTNCPIPHEL